MVPLETTELPAGAWGGDDTWAGAATWAASPLTVEVPFDTSLIGSSISGGQFSRGQWRRIVKEREEREAARLQALRLAAEAERAAAVAEQQRKRDEARAARDAAAAKADADYERYLSGQFDPNVPPPQLAEVLQRLRLYASALESQRASALAEQDEEQEDSDVMSLFAMALDDNTPDDIDHEALMQWHQEASELPVEPLGVVPPPRQIMRAMGELWKQVEEREKIEGEAKAKELNSINETLASVNQAIETLVNMIGELNQEMIAPAEIVRGKDGRVSHVKKGSRTITVQRGDDNKIKALH